MLYKKYKIKLGSVSGCGKFTAWADVPVDAADEDVHPEQPPGGAHHARAEPPARLRAPPSAGCHEVGIILLDYLIISPQG